MEIFQAFWPWWLGALALSATCLGYLYLLKMPCGVTGILTRVIFWTETHETARVTAFAADNAKQSELNMLKATADAFGDEAPEELHTEITDLEARLEAEGEHANDAVKVKPHPAGYLVFMASLVIGGLLSAWLKGNWSISWDMGDTYSRFFGDWSIISLSLGGILVGFGTAMAGGCTMGHGVSGNASMQPGSLMSTACFFGTAIVASFILEVVR